MTGDSGTQRTGPGNLVQIVIEGEDLMIAAAAYAIPVARMLRPGAMLACRSITFVESTEGVGDLSAVVEFEAVGGNTPGPVVRVDPDA